MSAFEAIAYVRERNIAERNYNGQQPPGGAMHNKVFRELIAEIERERDAAMPLKSPDVSGAEAA